VKERWVFIPFLRKKKGGPRTGLMRLCTGAKDRPNLGARRNEHHGFGRIRRKKQPKETQPLARTKTEPNGLRPPGGEKGKTGEIPLLLRDPKKGKTGASGPTEEEKQDLGCSKKGRAGKRRTRVRPDMPRRNNTEEKGSGKNKKKKKTRAPSTNAQG